MNFRGKFWNLKIWQVWQKKFFAKTRVKKKENPTHPGFWGFFLVFFGFKNFLFLSILKI